MKRSMRAGKIQQTAFLIAAANIFTGFATPLTNNYTTYSWTDLNGLSPELYASCTSVMGILMTALACISGILVTKTRSRWGQTRPWLIILPPVCMAGGILTFTGWGSSAAEKAAILCVAYILAYGTNDLITAARTTLYGLMAGDHYEARTIYVSYHWLGSNVGMLIAGGVTLTLVNLFGKNSQHRGFIITEIIMTVLVLLGYGMLVVMGKKSDPSNIADVRKKKKETVSIKEMLKGIVTNRCIMSCIFSDVFRFTGYYAMIGITVYQCTYVFDNMNAMTLVLTISGFSCVLGNYCAPYIVEKVGGRKKNMQIFGGLISISSLMIGIFGKSQVGFIVCLSAAFFFMSFIDSVDYAMYLDAGEYHMYRTGTDIRAFFVSMYGLAVKISSALSAIVIGLMLKGISYHAGIVLDAVGKTRLSWYTALTMAVGYGMPVLIMKLHPISDKEMAEAARANVKNEED
ncbi:hypothetical protein DWX43_08865 [Clostridium sp. AF19-22AC]|jgi:GPH family glycoside/pentoside/hexuronide:cation symporter|uniref:MFS transporter n=1 Tax=Clostridia TaxID=186801 RepID=UPI000E48E4C1|nr:MULTISPECIES: MFS transporter [Clostridia]RHR30271.1 hypothetical protein DWX43_08865 [Clostridium sp. AF19-22AC]